MDGLVPEPTRAKFGGCSTSTILASPALTADKKYYGNYTIRTARAGSLDARRTTKDKTKTIFMI